jgi:O-antigen ligase
MNYYFAPERRLLLWIKEYLAVILVLLAVFLFVSKSLYNYPITVMAFLGFIRLLRSPGKTMTVPGFKSFVTLFLCIWIPMLLALIQAVSFKHSLTTVIPYVRFLFMGIYLISELISPTAKKSLLLGIFSMVAFWCIDAISQVLFSIDFFGYPYESRHITGMFYPKNTIAHVCAGLSPLYFELIRQRYTQYKSALLLLFPLFIVILLSGRRAAWVMLAVSVTGYLYYFITRKTKFAISTKQIVVPGAVLIAVLLAIVVSHGPTNRKVKVTLGLFSTNYETVDKATARRLPLWLTSLRMARDNWINGVGPRGYRHAYARYAGNEDYWKETGQTHPHQLVLEVLTETGVIGILGLIFFPIVFYRFVKLSSTDPPLFPWAWAVVVVIFPLNTHMAFYGSFWSSFVWLLLALCFVAANDELKPENNKAPI